MSEVEQDKISPNDFMDKVGSLAAGVFILYLMVSFNFIPEIFGCHLQSMLKNNYLLKHLVGLMTVFFFINVTTTTLPWHLGIKFAFSLVLYVLFLFSNKSEYASQIGFLIVVFISYIMQLVRDQWQKYITDKKDITPEEKEKLTNQSVLISRAQLGLFVTGLILILVGHIAYIGKKKMEFKGEFSYWQLLKGSSGCKGTDARVYTVKEALSEGLSFFDSKDEIARREIAKRANIAKLFAPELLNAKNEINLNVPSGLSWTSPSPKDIVLAGNNANLPLSEYGQSILNSATRTDEIPLMPAFVEGKLPGQ